VWGAGALSCLRRQAPVRAAGVRECVGISSTGSGPADGGGLQSPQGAPHQIEPDASTRQQAPMLVRSCGRWWPREGTCVIAEPPLVVRTEPGTRLHDTDGPAILFPDGWSVHSWHGTRVPAWVIEEPTVELIAAERNVEVRRCAIEHLGWPAVVDQAGLTLVGQSADPGNPGRELRLYELPPAAAVVRQSAWRRACLADRMVVKIVNQ
jgi:hypothetical protein